MTKLGFDPVDSVHLIDLWQDKRLTTINRNPPLASGWEIQPIVLVDPENRIIYFRSEVILHHFKRASSIIQSEIVGTAMMVSNADHERARQKVVKEIL